MDKILDRIIESQQRKKLRVPLAIGGILALLIIWQLSSSQQSAHSLSANSISTFKIERGNFSDHIRLRGIVTPSKSVFLDSISGGRVEEKFIEHGTFVNKGEPLLQLSNPSLQLEVMSREAQAAEQLNFLRNTQMVMETNKLNLERDVIEINYQLQQINRKINRSIPLVEQGAIVKDDLVSLREEFEYLEKRKALTLKRQEQENSIRKVQVAQLEESAEMLQKNLSFARQNLENLLVKAPVSGYLSDFDVDIGETKTIGERLGQIDIPDEYKVVINIDEFYLSKVSLNSTAAVSVNGRNITSKISKIDSRVANSQFQAEVSLPTDIDSLKVGQTLNVDLYLGETTPNALLMKQGSFYSTTGGHWVFVVDNARNVAEKRRIRLGRKNQKYYEVLAGLNEGDEVIISSYETYDEAQQLELDRNI